MKIRLPLAAGMLLGLGGAALWLDGGILPDTSLFRSPGELDSLRAVLNHPAAFRTLDELAASRALWQIDIEKAAPETGETGAYLHHFDFASHRGLSARRYRLTVRSAALEGGGRAVREVAGSHIGSEGPPVALVGSGRCELAVIRGMLNDDGRDDAGNPVSQGVYEVLAGRLEEDEVRAVRVFTDTRRQRSFDEIPFLVEVATAGKSGPGTMRFATHFVRSTATVGPFTIVDE